MAYERVQRTKRCPRSSVCSVCGACSECSVGNVRNAREPKARLTQAATHVTYVAQLTQAATHVTYVTYVTYVARLTQAATPHEGIDSGEKPRDRARITREAGRRADKLIDVAPRVVGAGELGGAVTVEWR